MILGSVSVFSDSLHFLNFHISGLLSLHIQVFCGIDGFLHLMFLDLIAFHCFTYYFLTCAGRRTSSRSHCGCNRNLLSGAHTTSHKPCVPQTILTSKYSSLYLHPSYTGSVQFADPGTLSGTNHRNPRTHDCIHALLHFT